MTHHLRSLITLTLRSPAIKQSAIMTLGNISTGGIMVVAMIFASRALGPADFGVFSVSIAVMSVLSKGVDLGLNQLVPRLMNRWAHTHQDKQQAFLGQLIKWKLWLLAGTLIISSVGLPIMQTLLRYPHTAMLVWAVVGVVGMSVFEHIALVLAAKHKFGWLATMGITQALMKVVGFVVFLFWFPQSVNAVAGVYYLAPFVAAGILGWYFRDVIWTRPTDAPVAVRKEIFSFLTHASIGVVAMTLILNVDVLLVQRYLNPFETGLYAGATRIAGAIGFVTASVGGVLNNRVSRYRDKDTLKTYLKKSSLLIFASVVGFALFVPFSQLAVLLTIGPEYLGSVLTLNILVLNTFIGLATVPYISFFYTVDHPEYFSIGGIMQVVIILVGSWLFLPLYGITAAAWTRVIASAVFAAYTAWYVWYAYRKL